MRPSRLIAVVAYLGLVPASVGLAYAGSSTGLYGHGAIPIVFALCFSVGLTVIFVSLSAVRSRLENVTGPADRRGP